WPLLGGSPIHVIAAHFCPRDRGKKRQHGEMLPRTIRAIICGPSKCGKINVLISLLESPNAVLLDGPGFTHARPT
ncbi:hypothetical protein ALC56_04102, partial [Trachymyrmex septentrionalis]